MTSFSVYCSKFFIFYYRLLSLIQNGSNILEFSTVIPQKVDSQKFPYLYIISVSGSYIDI